MGKSSHPGHSGRVSQTLQPRQAPLFHANNVTMMFNRLFVMRVVSLLTHATSTGREYFS